MAWQGTDGTAHLEVVTDTDGTTYGTQFFSTWTGEMLIDILRSN